LSATPSAAPSRGSTRCDWGELRLWSEPGPFAALVAVIRGDPPEGLHDTLRNALSHIHAERHHALESFNGDSGGFGDVEAQLRELVALGEHAAPRVTRGRVVLLGWLLLLLLLAGHGSRGGGTDQRLWEGIWSGCEPSQEL
jgi:OOP family OmpA-OmpF porin